MKLFYGAIILTSECSVNGKCVCLWKKFIELLVLPQNCERTLLYMYYNWCAFNKSSSCSSSHMLKNVMDAWSSYPLFSG